MFKCDRRRLAEGFQVIILVMINVSRHPMRALVFGIRQINYICTVLTPRLKIDGARASKIIAQIRIRKPHSVNLLSVHDFMHYSRTTYYEPCRIRARLKTLHTL